MDKWYYRYPDSFFGPLAGGNIARTGNTARRGPRKLTRLTLAAVCALLLALAGPALAQDPPGAGPLATAQAAERAAQDARQEAAGRAAALEATARAGYAQATAAVVQATGQAQAQASATAAQATARVQANREALAATSAALSARATGQALDAAATQEALRATATVQALQAGRLQATGRALELDQSRRRAELGTAAWQIGLAALLALAFLLVWRALRWVKGSHAVTVPLEGAEVIDVEPEPAALLPAGGEKEQGQKR